LSVRADDAVSVDGGGSFLVAARGKSVVLAGEVGTYRASHAGVVARCPVASSRCKSLAAIVQENSGGSV
jgi:hypothetical protein